MSTWEHVNRGPFCDKCECWGAKKEEGEKHEGCGGAYRMLSELEACKREMVLARKAVKKDRDYIDTILRELAEAKRTIATVRNALKLVMLEEE